MTNNARLSACKAGSAGQDNSDHEFIPESLGAFAGGFSRERKFRPDLSQDEFDREFFDRILQRNDSDSLVLRRQAELLARQGDHQSALKLDRRLVELHPDDPIVQYNAACSLAMTGCVAEAIRTLERAVELGYSDFAHMEVDADLDLIAR